MYTYPDKDDLLTIELIDSVSQGNYWGESEDNILKIALDEVKKLRSPHLLDVGCGLGRLFKVFAPHVKSIYALEPDRQRYNEALKSAEDINNIPVTVINSDSSSLEENRTFDVILSSHVLQHIPENIADNMIKDFSEHLTPGGIVIVTTTTTDNETDILTKEYFEDKKRICKVVDEDEFKKSFSEDGVLPVRLFSDRTIPKMFAKHGFDLMPVRKYYHYYSSEHNGTVEDDDKFNEIDCTSKARDILFIFQKSTNIKDEITIDANLSFQYSINIYDSYSKMSYDERIKFTDEKIKQAFPTSISEDDAQSLNDPVFKDIKIAQDFLYGYGLPFACKRFKINGLELKFSEGNMTETAITLTIHPEFSCAMVMFSFKVEDATTDDMVYYRQQFDGVATFISKDGEAHCIRDWFKKIAGIFGNYSDIDQTYLAEIKEIKPYDDIEDIINNEPKRLYGIICGDEGWEYVPEELAKMRMENQWSSRNFVKFISFGNNALLLNLNRSFKGKSYVAHQKAFGEAAYGGANPYFLLDCDVAGVNHGILFSQETVFAIKTMANRILNRKNGYGGERSSKSIGKEIRRMKEFRSELITIVNRVENLRITEIGELEQLLLRSYNITPLIDSIKYMLELVESDLDLLYQQSTNNLVNILTVAGLVLSALQLL